MLVGTLVGSAVIIFQSHVALGVIADGQSLVNGTASYTASEATVEALLPLHVIGVVVAVLGIFPPAMLAFSSFENWKEQGFYHFSKIIQTFTEKKKKRPKVLPVKEARQSSDHPVANGGSHDEGSNNILSQLR